MWHFIFFPVYNEKNYYFSFLANHIAWRKKLVYLRTYLLTIWIMFSFKKKRRKYSTLHNFIKTIPLFYPVGFIFFFFISDGYYIVTSLYEPNYFLIALFFPISFVSIQQQQQKKIILIGRINQTTTTKHLINCFVIVILLVNHFLTLDNFNVDWLPLLSFFPVLNSEMKAKEKNVLPIVLLTISTEKLCNKVEPGFLNSIYLLLRKYRQRNRKFSWLDKIKGLLLF